MKKLLFFLGIISCVLANEGYLDPNKLILKERMLGFHKNYQEQGCKNGNHSMCVLFARDLYESTNLAEKKRAVKIYEELCKLKNTEACTLLTHHYLSTGEEYNILKLLDFTCNAMGSFSDCNTLASIYTSGLGKIKQNLDLAVKYYKHTCLKDDVSGCFGLINIYRHFEGKHKDPKKALDVLEYLCKKKSNNEACRMKKIIIEDEKDKK